MCDRKVKIADLPQRGEKEIIIREGKVKRVKCDEGEKCLNLVG
ncbi:XtrA/YqaO family protein [Bacillus thermotolerans]|nr:XtrA/YqaO family protein [Bacillus thermotolerans]